MTTQYVPPVTYVDDGERFMQFVRHVRDTGECAMDTETTGLDRARDHVVLWSACPDESSRYCFSREMLDLYSKELAGDPDLLWYFTNQTFDFCMLNNSGVLVPAGDTYDTLAMDWLYDENRTGRHGLKETAWDHLGLNMNEFKAVFPEKKKGEGVVERFMRVLREQPEKAYSYASLDAWATFRVKKHLQGELENQYSLDGMCLWDYFQEVESPFTRVLYECCRRGVMVDVGYLDELSPRIQTRIDDLHKKLNRIAGREINPRSTPQLRELLFGKLGLDPVKMTAGGDSGNRQPSTDVEVLTKFADRGVEAAQLILDIRGLVKMKGTYVDGLRKWADDDLRIHPTLTQHVTVTGRLSSVDPNLQNVPRPGGDEFGIRSAFMPKQDHILIVVDYEQLEMRLMAHYSQDPNMIDVIRRGWDIHAGTASLMFNHEYDDIIAAGKRKKAAAKDSSIKLSQLEKDMAFHRQAAKSIGFGLNYGEGIEKLAKTLGVSQKRAKELKEIYFQPYPQVRDFIYGVHGFIAEHAMVETILGRPRRFHDMATIGPMMKKMGRWHLPGSAKANLAQCERQSVNSVIQGSAADVAKMAMIKCEYSPELRSLGAEMLLQVHDELLFEVPEVHAKEAMGIICDLMEHPFEEELLVPLNVDGGMGYSWSSAKA
jgi:DNA polymerase-1